MDFTKFNKGYESIDWGVTTKDWGFKKPRELGEGYVTKVSGFFFTKSKTDGALNPVAIGQGFLIGFSKTQAEKVKDILADKEAIEAIKRGECYIKLRSYKSDKTDKPCWAFDFVNTPEIY